MADEEVIYGKKNKQLADAGKAHAFWDTQPVPKMSDKVAKTDFGPVKLQKTEDTPTEEVPLATTLEWWCPDVNDEEHLNQIYELLSANYVEDHDSQFRFNYSKPFLKWAINPPGTNPQWTLAVRKKDTKKMLAFISGTPVYVRMNKNLVVKDDGEEKKDEEKEPTAEEKEKAQAQLEADNATHAIAVKATEKPMPMCEINFLCIHKVLREKRLAPLLIKEVTRRVNLTGVFQALYTSGTVLPTPFASVQYFHRSLNIKKLIEAGFSYMPKNYQRFNDPMAQLQRSYKLNDEPASKRLRPIQKADLPQAYELVTKYQEANFDVSMHWNTLEDFEHAFYQPNDNFLYTYVVDKEDGTVTDLASFYALPSHILNHIQHDSLNAAYCYYYATTTRTPQEMVGDMLIVARDLGFDVFNCLKLMKNDEKFLKELKFGPGDGNLQYYWYNWKQSLLDGSRLSIVML